MVRWNHCTEKKFVIEANLKRRHPYDFQNVELGHLLEPIERELAKRKYEASLPKDGIKEFQPMSSSNELDIEQCQARDIVAKKLVYLQPLASWQKPSSKKHQKN